LRVFEGFRRKARKEKKRKSEIVTTFIALVTLSIIRVSKMLLKSLKQSNQDQVSIAILRKGSGKQLADAAVRRLIGSKLRKLIVQVVQSIIGSLDVTVNDSSGLVDLDHLHCFF
jgi:hypothetical protein